MEFDPIARAKELMNKLQEEASHNGSNATFGVHVESNGTNEGNVYVRKEKPSGEVVLYLVSGQGGGSNE